MSARTTANRREAVGFMATKAWNHRRLFIAPLVCVLLQRIASAISLYSTGWIAGTVLAGDREGLLIVLAFVFAVAIFRTLVHNAMWWYLIHNLSHVFWGKLKGEVIDQVARREPSFFQRLSSEVISSRINDVGEIASLWRDALNNIVFDGFTFIVNLIILGFAVPTAVPVTLIGVAIFFALQVVHELRVSPLREEERDAGERGNDNAVIRIIAAAHDLLSNNALSLYAETVKESVWAHIRVSDKLMWLGINLRGTFRDFASTFTPLVVIVILGDAALKGEVSGTEFISLLAIAGSLFDGLWAFTEFGKDFMNRLPKIARLVSLLDEPVMYPVPKIPKQLAEVRVKIELKNVRFAYPARSNGHSKNGAVNSAARKLAKRLGLPTFNIDHDKDKRENTLYIPYLLINPGDIIALVGPSGGGKTTLIKLILGLIYPDSGQVLINGIPTTELGFAEICKVFGTISQAIQILDGSIAENVLLAAEPYTEEQEDAVIAALQATGFWDVVKTWTNNLYEQVGSKGVTLSGGQRQMLALARMLIKQPANLILDEATAALDMITERMFGEAIARLSRRGTTIVIAHRLASIVNADRILVISRGQIVEDGTHLELLDKRGHYYLLWNQGEVVDAA